MHILDAKRFFVQPLKHTWKIKSQSEKCFANKWRATETVRNLLVQFAKQIYWEQKGYVTAYIWLYSCALLYMPIKRGANKKRHIWSRGNDIQK